MVFRISLFVVVALALVAGLAPQSFEAVSKALLAAVIQNAGWLYLLIVFLTLVFLIIPCFRSDRTAADRRYRRRTRVFHCHLAGHAVCRRHGHWSGVLGRR